MNQRRRTWPLLAGALWLVAFGTAWGQTIRFDPPAQNSLKQLKLSPQTPSHMPLEQDPNIAGMADQLLEQRLNLAREAHELEKVPDLLQRLAQDPEFLKALQKDLTPEQKKQLAKLSRDLVLGKSPQDNPAWNELLKGLRSNQGDLDRVLKDKLGGDANLLKRWAEKQPEPGTVPDGTSNGPPVLPENPGRPSEGPKGPPASVAQMNSAPPPPPKPSLWQRMEEKSTTWFKEHVNDWAKDMGDWADSPLGNSVRNALRRAGQHGSPEGLSFDLSDKTRGLANTLGKFGQYLPTERLRSIDLAGRLRGLSLPSLPAGGMRAPSLASVPRAAGGGVVQGLLWALVLLTLCGVLWKSLRWYREQSANGDGWKLGPWPVRPDAVSTRDELVSAFEYLALLCLGPVALACNHLDLAARLGSREGADDEQRRAAEHLARLYEQARYAPGLGPLPPEELAGARRNLCLLAGVAVA
jgi:hypothetical protein